MFDLLSAEYGWTDEEILDLTFGRVMLAVDAIGRRRRDHQAARVRLAEIVTQHLMVGMAHTTWSGKAAKALIGAAKKLRFTGGDDEKQYAPIDRLEELLGGNRG